ncbi:class I SAM-dependent methyltransferase [Streptomyces sp. NBC_01136]|uniref:class I SAM-dependent methyltransferase n=1 Tax=unclassified Streptomyces TaxID=2593676 RepID=UPI0032445716|nr:class I SAM-dependent methyltransferase [Streptomyces sp. NBC_01136]
MEFFALLGVKDEPAIVHSAIPAGATILELGAGAGRVTRELVALGHSMVAVDECPEMLEYVDTEVICGRIEDLRLGRRFDAVLLGSFLLNSADESLRRRFLDTCRNHLQPDGALLIRRTVPHRLPGAGSTGSGSAMISVADVRRAAENLVVATLEYRMAGRVWTHTITNHELDDEQLVVCLREADLEFDAFLTEDRTWVRARPCS